MAGLLAIILAPLGLHRFYLGFPVAGFGICFLSLVSFGILGGLLSFVEGLMIFAGGFRFDGEGKVLTW